MLVFFKELLKTGLRVFNHQILSLFVSFSQLLDSLAWKRTCILMLLWLFFLCHCFLSWRKATIHGGDVVLFSLWLHRLNYRFTMVEIFLNFFLLFSRCLLFINILNITASVLLHWVILRTFDRMSLFGCYFSKWGYVFVSAWLGLQNVLILAWISLTMNESSDTFLPFFISNFDMRFG